MSLGEAIDYTKRWIDACIVLIGVRLIRCAMISLPVVALILLLRRTVFRRMAFGRCALWSLLLFLPFLGSLRLHYETMAGLKASWWLVKRFMQYRILDYLYVGGIVLLFFIMLSRRWKLKKELSRMEQSVALEAKLDGNVGGFRKKVAPRVYISDMAVSPFTMGLFRPHIVIPRILAAQLSEAELDIILRHEQTHIRLGHLWMLKLWELVQCIFWVNPLIWRGLLYFKEDLEQVCDKVCMQSRGADVYTYGYVLLKSGDLLSEQLRLCRQAECVKKGGIMSRLRQVAGSIERRFKYDGFAAFAGEHNYRILKRRIQAIAGYRHYAFWRPALAGLACAGLLATGFFAIHQNSYPKFTEYDDLDLYVIDRENIKNMQCVLRDSGALREAVEVRENTVYVHRQALEALLLERDVQDMEFFLYFGGYYKLPGIGGGGNGVFVDLQESQGDLVIPYDSSKYIW
ncbi:MAG: M56 family metallopeptidase, partial [Lachnospiraceae bacterium]|nr:M56 family metallopeptidase [Lachnospiraceae bacterium]